MVAAPQLARWTPTDDDLLDMAVSRRQDLIRFKLFTDGDYAGELRPSLTQPATIEVDTTRTVPRHLQGFTLLPSDQAAINVLTDRVVAELELENRSVWPLGTFMWSEATDAVKTWGNLLPSQLTDEMFILDQPIGRVFGVRKGTDLIQTAKNVAREVFPNKTVVSDIGSVIARSPLTWQPSHTRRQVCDDCMKQAGWLPPFIDANNQLAFRSTPDLNTDPPVASYGRDTHVIDGSVGHGTDRLTSPNRWIVICNDGQGPPIIGKWEVPASYPHSRANRGFYITVTESMQGLDTVAQANAAAKRMGMVTPRAYETFEFDSTLDPRHDTFSVVAWGTTGFLEESHRMELISGGVHQHKIRRVV